MRTVVCLVHMQGKALGLGSDNPLNVADIQDLVARGFIPGDAVIGTKSAVIVLDKHMVVVYPTKGKHVRQKGPTCCLDSVIPMLTYKPPHW